MLHEVKRLGQLALLANELNAVLFDEPASPHLGQHVEALENPVGLGNERLADVKAREALALEQLNLDALLSDERGRGGPRWPAANDDDLGRVGNSHMSYCAKICRSRKE